MKFTPMFPDGSRSSPGYRVLKKCRKSRFCWLRRQFHQSGIRANGIQWKSWFTLWLHGGGKCVTSLPNSAPQVGNRFLSGKRAFKLGQPSQSYKYILTSLSISLAGSSHSNCPRPEHRIVLENELSIVSNISSRSVECNFISMSSRIASNISRSASGSNLERTSQSSLKRTSK